MNDNRHQADHDRVQRMVELAADRDVVWAEIGGFGAIAGWHPLIASVELTEIEGRTFRHLTTTDDELFFERLIEVGPHHLTYEVVEGPLPVSDYRATLSCVAEADGCRVFWSAYFTPAEDAGRVPDDIVGAFYEIGLRALRERFG
ncbi:SRPBCC family protein [Pikeienuella piscinae]|uniref:SRPBCC family protein n=1 Tax=Pikeienuella piscinae TaxID=2748098 RepID=A0A7L5BZ59_9RHOB|nr:SRPBCC family protein [Pikeienuella piscinae]QIE56118.1 SRPBCC family protein [Pikeienuella piscinae]